jgi:hypothetical protein
LSPGTWYHGAVTYDGANILLYLNGSEVGRAATTGLLDTDPTVPAQLGRNTGGSLANQWDGLLDDVRLYNRALSAAEIAALMTPAPPGVRGDIDGNNQVTLADLRLQIRMLVGSIPSTPAAELTGDSQLTLADLRALIRILVGGP